MSRMITDQQRRAAQVCLERNIPFALFAYPGDEQFRFFASLPDKAGECRAFADEHESVFAPAGRQTFFIGRFGSDEPYLAGVRNDLDETALLGMLDNGTLPQFGPSATQPVAHSTRRESYERAFRTMKKRLRHIGGKVVLARVKVDSSIKDIDEVATDYFEKNPLTFRYICYTPENGVWLGATPELLFRGDRDKGEVATMALAGTRLRGTTGHWDDKNLREQAIVREVIADRLGSLGLDVNVSTTSTLGFGPVEHICTGITASGCKDFSEVLFTLNPTPAVLGYPEDIATVEIDMFETQRRLCYAGAIGVATDSRIAAFVNLRCAFAGKLDVGEAPYPRWRYNLYAGGGIMPDSDLAGEWAETEAKMSSLEELIPYIHKEESQK